MFEGDTTQRIRQAVSSGRLAEPFRAADVNLVLNIDFAGTFLPKHRVGNPGGNTELFIQMSRGLYRLADRWNYMGIDNPYAAIDSQYREDDEGPISTLAKAFGGAADLGIPFAPIFATFFGFLNSKNDKARQERGMAFIRQLIIDIQRHEDAIAQMKTEMKEIQGAMSLSLEYDVLQFDDTKRDRYISTITHAISNETKVRDLKTFIQDIEKLGERDITGLNVLNKVMNKDGDWQRHASPPQLNPSKLHPNTFIQRAQELSVQMAEALAGKSEEGGNNFSREEGLQVCLRLQGFGLAEMISVAPREVPISNYSARLTTRGLMLLKLLGENVPNWDFYFDANGPL